MRTITNSMLSLLLVSVCLAFGASDALAQSGKSARSGSSSAKQPANRAKRPVAAVPSKRKAGTVARGERQTARPLKASYAARPSAPARMSMGQVIGLHSVDDPLDLRSSVALVVDQNSGATLFAKNENAVLPIASITKLMTALVVLDANQPLAETIEITEAEIDTEKHTRSRLRIGTRLSRGELLQLALMASENRAAHALGRSYPGGLAAFIDAMNAKARALGMNATSFSDPTGLSSRNMSSAVDLARLVGAAHSYPLVRDFSTAPELAVDAGRIVGFRNTNRLISSPSWEIGLQKTGYISEAGSCLVMQMNVDGRALVLVLLDATGKHSRFGDAQRIREWLEADSRRVPLRTTQVGQPAFGS